MSTSGGGTTPLSGSRRFVALTIFLFGGVLFWLLAHSMGRPLNHDEEQSVAAGALLARGAGVPYRDFVFTHTPNLSLVLAILFHVSDHLLLSARLFSVFCGWLLSAVIFGVACRCFSLSKSGAAFFGIGAVLLLVTNRLFIAADGLAWNHDLSTLLAVAAFLLLPMGDVTRHVRERALASGFCLGLAIGTRISWVPVVLPFLAALVWLNQPLNPRAGWWSKLGPGIVFCGGMAFGLLPTFWLAATTLARFEFSTFGFHRLRAHDPTDLAFRQASRVAYKAKYFMQKVAFSCLPLVIGFFALAFPWWQAGRSWRERLAGQQKSVFLWLLLPFVALGTFLPTPHQYQYFYALVPFTILAVLYGCATCGPHLHVKVLFAVAVLASTAFGVKYFPKAANPFVPAQWVPMQVHQIGRDVRQALRGSGRVLTLAPVFPLEGGLEIYPAFANGPFSWKYAQLAPGQAESLHMVGTDDLTGLLARTPPAAILVGHEGGDVEMPLAEWARQAGFMPRQLADGTTLWQPTPP